MTAEPADTGFEERLHRRIAVNQAARRMTARQRQVLRARLQGYSLEEVSKQAGISRERIRQHEQRALERLAEPRLALQDQVPLPLRLAPHEKPKGFDREAFLEHMRHLIQLRERRFDDECNVLRRMVESQDKDDRQTEEMLARREEMARAMAKRHEEMARAQTERHERWLADRAHANQLKAQREREWGNRAALVCRVDIGDEALRLRANWIAILSATHGWEQTVKWVDQYDAQVAASKPGEAA